MAKSSLFGLGWAADVLFTALIVIAVALCLFMVCQAAQRKGRDETERVNAQRRLEREKRKRMEQAKVEECPYPQCLECYSHAEGKRDVWNNYYCYKCWHQLMSKKTPGQGRSNRINTEPVEYDTQCCECLEYADGKMDHYRDFYCYKCWHILSQYIAEMEREDKEREAECVQSEGECATQDPCSDPNQDFQDPDPCADPCSDPCSDPRRDPCQGALQFATPHLDSLSFERECQISDNNCTLATMTPNLDNQR